ncbi:23S rRNA (uracil(1939)-C(5))-methyltransferase RlmD [Caviibacter abscessus]|uniref:23S rRNA (uracil(1939)-C(5))-methyltransferase RlmD n=1 Tax=Caviibacter abscessus TaxID=1766719 RepID=UPI0008359272|nr:23S rRNA (uracil(1939)-C(5))-methyltransferase RlmD [Caviibacter abscessus]
MKKGDIVELYIQGVDYPAKFYGYLPNDDRKYYCNINLKKGQKVRGRIGRIKNNKVEVRDIQIISSDTTPFCNVFNSCGGCSFQYYNYDEQLEIKSNHIKKMISDNIGDDFIFEKPVRNPKETGYRNKMEYSFGNEFLNGPTVLGLHKKNSFHDIVDVCDCKLIDEDFKSILIATNTFFQIEKIDFYHRTLHKGYLRNLIIRKGEKTKELLINLVTSSQNDDDNLIKRYKDKLLNLKLDKKIVGILHTINDNLSDSVESEKEKILYGRRDIEEKLFDLSFNISPYSFFQTNSFAVEKLYSKVTEYLSEVNDGKNVVYDLFSGTGTIGQIVSKHSKMVYGIELIEEAVEKANENTKKNKISNAKFIAGDVFEKLNEIEDRPDILILDPPRAGVGEKTINKLTEYGVNYIIYVSCNPKTLVEDLKTFKKQNYKLIKAACVDMFSYTTHVECIALIQRVKS